MINLFSARSNMAVQLRLGRGQRFVKMYGSVVQKTKVELMASPSQRKCAYVALSASRRCSEFQIVGRSVKTSSFQWPPFSGVFPRCNSGHSSLSDRLASLHDGGLFARPLMSSSRHKSSSTPTGRQSVDFSREWRERKSAVYFIVAVCTLTGGAMYAYYRYKYGSSSPRTTCQAEADISLRSTEALKGKSLSLQEAIAQASDLCQRVKDETGSPGLVVAVSVDGQQVWAQGFGYADVENRLPCKSETVIRIASISKPITMTAIAKAMEEGKLDLDKPVQVYVPKFPEKTFNGEKVMMTTRQLVSHMSGIRHYDKGYMNKNSTATPKSDPTSTPKSDPTSTPKSDPTSTPKSDPTSTPTKQADNKDKTSSAMTSEFQHKEYFIKDKYETTEAALALFKDDPLVHKPGTKFLYSSHAWTLVAAVLEGATNTKFPVLMRRLFLDLGLDNTYLDENEPLIYNRARNYIRRKYAILVNAPFVDCSYKYAGGGMLSTMPDLLQFANAMLYSYQFREAATGRDPATEEESKAVTFTEKDNRTGELAKTSTPSSTAHHKQPLPGYLKSSTVDQLWTALPEAKELEWEDLFYGMGWEVMPGNMAPTGFSGKNPMYVLHTGGAVGASSVLLILPTTQEGRGGGGDGGPPSSSSSPPPRGVCVAMAVNLVSVSLRKTALQIARVFARVSDDA